MRQRYIALMLLIGTLAGGTALVAQRQPSPETPHALPSPQLPRVYLVEDFLTASHAVSEEDSATKAHFLSLIGIEPGSRAEEAFWRAAARVYRLEFGEAGPIERVIEDTPEKKHVIRYQHLGASVPPPVSADELQQREIAKAVALADIYRDLIDELAVAGATITSIETYFNRAGRQSTSLVSSHPFDDKHPIWEVARAFEERLAQ